MGSKQYSTPLHSAQGFDFGALLVRGLPSSFSERAAVHVYSRACLPLALYNNIYLGINGDFNSQSN